MAALTWWQWPLVTLAVWLPASILAAIIFGLVTALDSDHSTKGGNVQEEPEPTTPEPDEPQPDEPDGDA